MKSTLPFTAAALCCAALALPAHAADITISPLVTTVQSGQAFTLTLAGSGFPDALLGGGLDIAWDPSVMDLAAVNVDGVTWEFASFGGTLDAAAGTLQGLVFASFDGHAGSFAIATLDFVADQPGTGAVTLAPDPFQPFIDAAGAPVAVNLGGARVAVSAVPEPAAWALMAGGVAALLVRRRLSGRR